MKKLNTILGMEAFGVGYVTSPFKMKNCGRKRRVTIWLSK
jgi:hypothetical protein